MSKAIHSQPAYWPWFAMLLGVVCIALPVQAKGTNTSVDPLCSAQQVAAEPLSSLAEVTRKFLFFRIYELALALPSAQLATLPADTAQRAKVVLKPEQRKRLTLTYQRDLRVAKVREVLEDGFRNSATDQQWLQHRMRLQGLFALMRDDVKEGDQLTLEWLPQCGLLVFYNGQLALRQPDAEFTQLLLGIWLGPNSVIDRSALLSLPQ